MYSHFSRFFRSSGNPANKIISVKMSEETLGKNNGINFVTCEQGFSPYNLQEFMSISRARKKLALFFCIFYFFRRRENPVHGQKKTGTMSAGWKAKYLLYRPNFPIRQSIAVEWLPWALYRKFSG